MLFAPATVGSTCSTFVRVLNADARAVLELALQRCHARQLLLILELLDAQRDVVLHLMMREDGARLEAANVLAEERLRAQIG